MLTIEKEKTFEKMSLQTGKTLGKNRPKQSNNLFMNETHHNPVGFSLDMQLSNPFENRSVLSFITE